jgi:hypothetical protein
VDPVWLIEPRPGYNDARTPVKLEEAAVSEIIIPDEVAAALAQATGPVTLRTQSGRRLGDFTPEPPVPWDPTITHEELERRVRESRGRTLDEVLRKLGIE